MDYHFFKVLCTPGTDWWLELPYSMMMILSCLICSYTWFIGYHTKNPNKGASPSKPIGAEENHTLVWGNSIILLCSEFCLYNWLVRKKTWTGPKVFSCIMCLSDYYIIVALHSNSPIDDSWSRMKIERIAGSCQYFLLHLCTQVNIYFLDKMVFHLCDNFVFICLRIHEAAMNSLDKDGVSFLICKRMMLPRIQKYMCRSIHHWHIKISNIV